MFRIITITHQYENGGTKLASLIAQKLGWELLDYHLADRISRIVDLHFATAVQHDEQAVRWWRRLRHAGIDPAACRPYVSPRWSDEVDEDSVHDLATHLIQAAGDLGECVLVGYGAQCLLHGRSDVFNVLIYAPIEKRVQGLQARHPEYTDAQGLRALTDSQRAGYIHRYYGRDLLDPMLYDLCVSTSIGLDRAATLINDAVVFPDMNWTPAAEEEVSLCHSSIHP